MGEQTPYCIESAVGIVSSVEEHLSSLKDKFLAPMSETEALSLIKTYTEGLDGNYINGITTHDSLENTELVKKLVTGPESTIKGVLLSLLTTLINHSKELAEVDPNDYKTKHYVLAAVLSTLMVEHKSDELNIPFIGVDELPLISNGDWLLMDEAELISNLDAKVEDVKRFITDSTDLVKSYKLVTLTCIVVNILTTRFIPKEQA